MKVTTQIRVRYADTDQMKFVYYAKYFEYFEQGRSDLLREIGLPYPEIEKRGIFLPVIEAHAEYISSAHFDDLLEVTTILNTTPSSTIRIEYELRNVETKELLGTGYTVHCFLNAENGKPTRAPKYFLDAVVQKI
jgi:acyl-CoA thioester hydrolase